MATPDDQPRPDLDAALDAVLPSLTAVSDDAAAAALRRTRLALATPAVSPPATAWRWSLTAAAMAGVIALVTAGLWQRPAPAPGRIAQGRPEAPVVARPPATPASSVAPGPDAPKRVAGAELGAPRPDRRRTRPVQATSAPADAAVAPPPDPLIALVREMQDIPEEAWNASLTRAGSPVSVPDVAVNPIVVPELVTPPIADPSADVNAPGDF